MSRRLEACAALALSLLAAPAAGDWADWIAEADVGFRYDSNLNNAVDGSEEEYGLIWHPAARVGRVFQLPGSTRLHAAVEVRGQIHHRWNELDAAAGEGQLAVSHKFGLGDAPWGKIFFNGGYEFVQDRPREGSRFQVGMQVGKRFSPRALLLRAGTHFAWHRCKFHPERAQDPIPGAERQLCAHDVDTEATETLVFRVPYEVAALYRAARETLRKGMRQPVGDGEVFGAMMDHALLAWSLRDPRARRPDPVIERDGYECAFPGCTSRRNLHDHHIVFRSQGGGDEESNRVTLCAFHHLRGVHAGLLRVTGRAPDGLVFEMPLARYRSGDIEIPAGAGAVPRRAA